MSTGELQQKLENELEEVENLLAELTEKKACIKHKLDALRKQDEAREAASNNDKDWDNDEFPWSAELQKKLTEVFGFSTLRPLQKAAMNVTLSDKDLIVLMPTGAGKSLIYQLPALLADGFTLVISPLVSLMEDQVFNLSEFNLTCGMMSSGMLPQEITRVQRMMTDKDSGLKLLYVTPERLAKSKRFMNQLEKVYEAGLLQRIAIDEVHCCSQWGHDFRPDYKIVGILRRQFPKTSIIGLTATATRPVLRDVTQMLNIGGCVTLRSSFNRTNLFYEVMEKPSSANDCITAMLKYIKTNFPQKSGIVYCFSQRESEKVASDLSAGGVRASCYHASLSPSERTRVHKRWIDNHIQVVVATIAFGMGIDKPDVRFVLHHSLSKSLQNYYQESGRAGRDDLPARCVVMYRPADVYRQSGMVFTEKTGLSNLYQMAAYCQERVNCRRSLIASHFAETWDESLCAKTCDLCVKRSKCETHEVDRTEEVQKLFNLLDNFVGKKERVTGLKLACAWAQKVGRSKLSTFEAEWMIVHLLMSDILREDFHYTAYSTLSYILPGANSNAARRGISASCKFDILKIKVSVGSDSGESPSKDYKKKRGLMLINPTKSAFTSKDHNTNSNDNWLQAKTSLADAIRKRSRKVESVLQLDKVTCESDSDDVSSSAKRKRAAYLESDDDSSQSPNAEDRLHTTGSLKVQGSDSIDNNSGDDLNFGDSPIKPSGSLRTRERTQSAVVIDSDSNDSLSGFVFD